MSTGGTQTPDVPVPRRQSGLLCRSKIIVIVDASYKRARSTKGLACRVWLSVTVAPSDLYYNLFVFLQAQGLLRLCHERSDLLAGQSL